MAFLWIELILSVQYTLQSKLTGASCDYNKAIAHDG